MASIFTTLRAAILVSGILSTCSSTYAEMSAEELAKLAQNPVGNLISLPFQNNTNLNFGPGKGTQNILNIQPVIPISINEDWNIITRGGVGKIFRLGKLPVNTQISAYYNVARAEFAAN